MGVEEEMKIAVCDVCETKEVFTDVCPLVTKDICKKCNSREMTLEPIITDRPITQQPIVLSQNPSMAFTEKYLRSIKDGLTISNIDNVLLEFSTKNKPLNRKPRMMFAEYKSRTQKPYIISYGQWSIYKRLSDPQRGDISFLGTFVIWSNEYELIDSTEFKINGIPVSLNKLIEFMNMNMDVDSYHPIDFDDFEKYKTAMDKREQFI